MRALTTAPRRVDSTRIEEISEPAVADGDVLVRTLAVGMCGTDREIIAGQYGAAPAGRPRLVLGHEALGEVIEAPSHSGLAAGERVVPIVRIPDDRPCASCAAGSVNANRRHYEAAARALTAADPAWLDALITRRLRLDGWQDALRTGPDHVKTILEIGG